MSDFLEKILEDPLIEVGKDMDLEEFVKLYEEKREKVMKKLREEIFPPIQESIEQFNKKREKAVSSNLIELDD